MNANGTLVAVCPSEASGRGAGLEIRGLFEANKQIYQILDVVEARGQTYYVRASGLPWL